MIKEIKKPKNLRAKITAKNEIKKASKIALEVEMSFYNYLFESDYSFIECLEAHNMLLKDNAFKGFYFENDLEYLNNLAT